MKNVLEFSQKKIKKEKISMVTVYDYSFARIVADSEVDCVLVGDSLAMTILGHSSTLPVDVDTMALFTSAVVRGVGDKFVVGDLPFLSFRKGLVAAMEAVEKIMKAGAHAVKLEGVSGHEEIISHIVKSGVPVMAHLGLTPQSVHQMGGFKVQGRRDEEGKLIAEQAKVVEDLGCFSLVLECVPRRLARDITASLKIPTIGIGAGPDVDGQVLVLQDLLGMNRDFRPKFVKQFLNGNERIVEALNAYATSTRQGVFPGPEETFDI